MCYEHEHFAEGREIYFDRLNYTCYLLSAFVAFTVYPQKDTFTGSSTFSSSDQ